MLWFATSDSIPFVAILADEVEADFSNDAVSPTLLSVAVNI